MGAGGQIGSGYRVYPARIVLGDFSQVLLPLLNVSLSFFLKRQKDKLLIYIQSLCY